ncbi:uL15m family ribosomal protein [Nanoarchaeota archaeon]
MTFNKRKKNSRQRGSSSHGWGEKKKHRGAGSRGGRGRAGSGKRADTKKPSDWKARIKFGKFGFKKKGVVIKITPINIGQIQQNLSKYLSEGLIKEEAGAYSVDLESLGYNKLLGSGLVKSKFKIKTQYASESAVAKVKEKGGSVDTLDQDVAQTESIEANEPQQTESQSAPAKTPAEDAPSENSPKKQDLKE